MLVHHALAHVAAAFPSLAPELRAIGTLLEGQAGGLLSLPAAVLAAGLEAIAFGGHAAGTYHRRWAALEAAVFLHDKGSRPDRGDFASAVGLWTATIARAGASYRALASASETGANPARPSPAAALGSALAVLSTDVGVLVAAAEVERVGGRKAVLREVTTYVAHHTGMKGRGVGGSNKPLAVQTSPLVSGESPTPAKRRTRSRAAQPVA